MVGGDFRKVGVDEMTRKFTIGAVFAALWLACGAQAKADLIVMGDDAAGHNQYETLAVITKSVNSHIQEVFTADFRNAYNVTTSQQLLLITVNGVFNQLVGSDWVPVTTLTAPIPNNLSNLFSLSGVSFSPLTAGSQIVAASGYESTITQTTSSNNSGQIGTPTAVTGTAGNGMLGWSVVAGPGISTLNGGAPDHLITPYITNAIWNAGVQGESPTLLGSYPADPDYAGVKFFISDPNAKDTVKNLASVLFQFTTSNTNNPADIIIHFPPVNPNVAVPEPSSLALLGLGGIGLAVKSVRRRRQQAA